LLESCQLADQEWYPIPFLVCQLETCGLRCATQVKSMADSHLCIQPILLSITTRDKTCYSEFVITNFFYMLPVQRIDDICGNILSELLVDNNTAFVGRRWRRCEDGRPMSTGGRGVSSTESFGSVMYNIHVENFRLAT
jgi:hypothetical protein